MEKIKVYGNLDILDRKDWKKIHSVSIESWIEIDEEEDEWAATEKATELWSQMFDDFGIVEIDEVWT